MKTHDSEKLLGGYAAGILTDDEKNLLFSAAINHQELFDALADEEALRELLADPAVRQRLLVLLGDSRSRQPLKFWRRPAVLGLAASLFAMVTTSVLLWQRESPLPSKSGGMKAKSIEPSPTLSAEAPAEGKLLAKQREAEALPSGLPAKGNAKAATPDLSTSLAPQARPLPAPAPSLADPPTQKAEAYSGFAAEKKDLAADKFLPAAMDVAARTAKVDSSEKPARVAITEESLRSLPANRRMEAGLALAPGVTAGGAPAIGKTSMQKSALVPAALPAPTHVLERLEKGRLRLTVTWATGNHLYVLRRTDSGSVLLAPMTSAQDKTGRTVSIFEFPGGTKDHVDLYLLHQPARDPENLPAKTIPEGYQERVF